MRFTKSQKSAIKSDFLASIISWSGRLYHGSPLRGIACVLENGFMADRSMQTMGGILFSASNNPSVLELFGRDGLYHENGFIFDVDFKRVLVLSDFWYSLFFSGSGATSDMLADLLESDPNAEEKISAFGIDTDFDTDTFLDTFLPKSVEAIIIPGFFDKHVRGEREMAITPTGLRKLRGFLNAVVIDSTNNSWEYAKEALADMGVSAENCDERDQ